MMVHIDDRHCEVAGRRQPVEDVHLSPPFTFPASMKPTAQADVNE